MINGMAGPARRALAVSATLVALTAGAVVLAPAMPAAADDALDVGHPASLTIHRLAQPDDVTGLVPGDGAEVLPVPALPGVPGVDYAVSHVAGIDLGSPGGWSSAFALAGAFDAVDPDGSISHAGLALDPPMTGTTDADGVVAFTGLTVGAYLVEEIPAAPGATANLPFLVLLPVTDPVTPSSWLYDVHVYPKNATATHTPPPGFITKTVDTDQARRVGDRIEWKVTGEILDGGDVLWWRTTDYFDPRLSFVEARVRLLDGTPIAEGVDYEVVYDAADNSARVEFLGPPGSNGLAVLTAHSTTKVEIVFVTEVLDAATILNEAIINTAIWDDPVGVVEHVEGASAPAEIVTEPEDPLPGLAWTGFSNLPWALLGAGLVVGGYLLIVVGRRRRDEREDHEEATA